MMLRIRKYGDPVLHEKAEPVENIGEEVRTLANRMLETMHANNGIGLAAEQVGCTKSLCVVDLPLEMDMDGNRKRINPGINMPLILINPQIMTSSKETDIADEGCLSFPDIFFPITRAKSVNVRYLDFNGDNNEISIQGWLGRAVQHETDHLNGTLMIDRVSKIERMSISNKLKQLKKKTCHDAGIGLFLLSLLRVPVAYF